MDFFKIITAGEGGLCLANDEETYNHMQQLSDHGHDHIGNNRGMEQHPIIGTNFRLSELHAAVGLAQARKVNSIRNNNRAAKAAIRAELAQVKGVSFRPMPDPDGDSATFLNFFLPDQPTAHRVWKQLAADGLAGFNYWYINMYHFINQWDHIKNLTSPFKMAIHHLGAPQDYHNLHLPKSQEVIGRLISLGIKASWSVEEAKAFGAQVAQSIRKTISETAAV
jgi:8-amino-3,8-dideoxy-alpha-D-manno-octulosonate transaminase